MTNAVVYESTTGHVLGALVTPGRGGAPPVADLVGDGLPARVVLSDRTPVDVTVAAERLEAAAVAETAGLLADPMSFGVESVGGVPRSQLLRLATWGSGTVTVDADGVTIRLPADAPAGTPVLVALAGEDGPVAQLPAQMTGRQLSLRVSLAAGDYGVLTLVGGYAGRLEAHSVT